MIFSSVLFLFAFLPLTIILYYFCPAKARNNLLLLASLIFYGWGEPRYLFLMLAVILINFGAGYIIALTKRSNSALCKTIFVVSMVLTLGMLGFFKYTDFLLNMVNGITHANLSLLGLALPIGISFYTFQALSYTIDVYRGEVKAQRHFLNFALYITMFPQLIAGPIVKYKDIRTQLPHRRESADQFAQGIFQFVIGLAKKVLIANQAGAIWSEISSLPSESLGAATAWLGAIAFTFQIYFDFSGYSDMAIGLGHMFGFQFPENFHYPYESTSITDFWRRWHITLSSWFKEYVYIPLGGNRKGMGRQIFNMFIVWFLTGLWHGASWNFIIWGLYFFVFLSIEKLFLLRFMKHWPKALQHIYALFLIVFGWVIFACDDLGLLGRYIVALFGGNGISADLHFLHFLLNGLFILILAAICSTRLPGYLYNRFVKGTCPVKTGLTILLVVVLFFISVSFLISDSYNPFLYFRF